MALQLDAITTRKLVLVRQFYEHALMKSASAHDELSRTLAVIEFDLANETVLRATGVATSPSKERNLTFHALIDEVDKLLMQSNLGAVPNSSEIRLVHDIRNDAQHRAKFPSEAEVSDCRTYTRDFLAVFVANVWGKSLDQISLVDLVRHEQIRDYLRRAEQALVQGIFEEAVQNSAAGLSAALGSVQRALTGGLKPYSAEAFYTVTSWGSGQTLEQYVNKQVFAALISLQSTALYLALGISVTDFVHFQKIAGRVIWAGSGSPYFSGCEDVNPDSARFAVSFSINTICQIEASVGDIARPYGQET